MNTNKNRERVVRLRDQAGRKAWVKLVEKQGVWFVMEAGGFLGLDRDFHSSRENSWGVTERALERAIRRNSWQVEEGKIEPCQSRAQIGGVEAARVRPGQTIRDFIREQVQSDPLTKRDLKVAKARGWIST